MANQKSNKNVKKKRKRQLLRKIARALGAKKTSQQ
jgi:hypothetical protein